MKMLVPSTQILLPFPKEIPSFSVDPSILFSHIHLNLSTSNCCKQGVRGDGLAII